MERCPNCRARVTDTDRCRRCGMELGALLALEAIADKHVSHALRHLTNGEPRSAVVALQQAQSIKNAPLTAQLLRFASGLAQVSGAWKGTYLRRHSEGDSEP